MPQRLMPLIDSVSISHSASSPLVHAHREDDVRVLPADCVTTPSISVVAVVSNHADTL